MENNITNERIAVYDVVRAIVGDIKVLGETYYDKDTLKNRSDLMQLILTLTAELDMDKYDRHDPRASIQEFIKQYNEFREEMACWLNLETLD
jgi:hypothetical protein